MKHETVDAEQMAQENEEDRKAHAGLADLVSELEKHEAAMKIPVAVKLLVDDGVAPLVIAKVMLIGDRDGTGMYTFASRITLYGHRVESAAAHELVALRMLAIATSDVPPAPATQMLVGGAVWIATQFDLSRSLLAELVKVAAKSPATLAPRKVFVSAVDYVDHHGIRDRAWLCEAIEHAQLPLYAPLEYARG